MHVNEHSSYTSILVCLQRIVNIHWPDRISSKEFGRKLANSPY